MSLRTRGVRGMTPSMDDLNLNSMHVEIPSLSGTNRSLSIT